MRSILLILASLSCIALGQPVTLKICNNSEQTMTIWGGFLSYKLNKASDNDLVNNYNKYGIGTIRANLVNCGKIEIPQPFTENSWFVIFGKYNNGGRTTLYRFNTNDHRQSIEIDFPKSDWIKPSETIDVIRDALKPLGAKEDYIRIDNSEILGSFVIAKNNNGVIKYLYPIYIEDGKIIKSEQSRYDRIEEEVISNSAGASAEYDFYFGSSLKSMVNRNAFVAVKASVCNKRIVNIKPKSGGYFSLFMKCDSRDIETAVSMYSKDKEIKLIFIKKAILVDTAKLESYKTIKVSASAELDASKIITANGNYQKTSEIKNKYINSDMMSDVLGLDLTYILEVESLKKSSDLNSESIVSAFQELRKSIPELDSTVTDSEKIKKYIQEIAKNRQFVESVNLKDKEILNITEITPQKPSAQ